MVPDKFVGVWRRTSIALDDGAPTETQDVVWLQTRCTFADLRTPVDAPDTDDPATADADVEAFAGTTSWNAEELHWDHEFDWHRGFADADHGRVRWDGEDLLESGVMRRPGTDETVRYEERWRREATTGPAFALDGRSSGGLSALHVCVGAWMLTMATLGARFAVRLERPDADPVELGDGDFRAPRPGHPAWVWVERETPADELR